MSPIRTGRNLDKVKVDKLTIRDLMDIEQCQIETMDDIIIREQIWSARRVTKYVYVNLLEDTVFYSQLLASVYFFWQLSLFHASCLFSADGRLSEESTVASKMTSHSMRI